MLLARPLNEFLEKVKNKQSLLPDDMEKILAKDTTEEREESRITPNSIYEHFKVKESGLKNHYLVDGVAVNTETGEKLVVYRCLYIPTTDDREKYGLKPYQYCARPQYNFLEEVLDRDGLKVPRFKFVLLA